MKDKVDFYLSGGPLKIIGVVLIAILLIIMMVAYIQIENKNNKISELETLNVKSKAEIASINQELELATKKASEYLAMYLEEKAKHNIDVSLLQIANSKNNEMIDILIFVQDAIEKDCTNTIIQKKKQIKRILKEN